VSAIETVLSLIVGALALGVGVNVLYRYSQKKQLHQLLWFVGLLLWGISSFGQASAFIIGWVPAVYKLYYFSAIALAGFLGAGTLGLILSRRRAYYSFTLYILVVTAIMAGAISLSPLNLEVLKEPVVGGLALPSNARLLAPFINIPGGITFIGGAAYTFVRSRKLYALLITLGALTPALGGTLARFALPGFLPFTDFIGILMLSIGIYLSIQPKK
jgi:hypothetical protein